MMVLGMATKGMVLRTSSAKYVERPQEPDVQKVSRETVGSPNWKMEPALEPVRREPDDEPEPEPEPELDAEVVGAAASVVEVEGEGAGMIGATVVVGTSVVVGAGAATSVATVVGSTGDATGVWTATASIGDAVVLGLATDMEVVDWVAAAAGETMTAKVVGTDTIVEEEDDDWDPWKN